MTQDNGDRAQSQPADLQFDQAEYSTPAPPTPTCGACQQTIADQYYMAGQAVICQRCRDGLTNFQTGGSGLRRFSAALGWGLAAAVVGSLIWFGVRKLTGYEIGLVAIVVGLIVGAGVRKGSRARGGWLYQTMAVLLTYCSIVSQYMPDVYKALMEKIEAEDRVAMTTIQPTAADRATTSTMPAGEGAGDLAANDVAPVGAGMKILAVVFVVAVLFIIAFIAPVLAGFENIIGLLIIGFALYEAWKLNKRQVIEFSGPYPVTAESVAQAGASA